MYFALMGVLQYIPLCVFSAILISVAINMSRFPLFAKLAKFGIRDSIILFVTFVLTVVFDLTVGVLAGAAVTFLVNLQNIKTGLAIEKIDNGALKAKGTLFFMNANKLIIAIEAELPSATNLTVDLSEIERIDETALEKIAATQRKATTQGYSINFIGHNEKIRQRFDRFSHILSH